MKIVLFILVVVAGVLIFAFKKVMDHAIGPILGHKK